MEEFNIGNLISGEFKWWKFISGIQYWENLIRWKLISEHLLNKSFTTKDPSEYLFVTEHENIKRLSKHPFRNWVNYWPFPGPQDTAAADDDRHPHDENCLRSWFGAPWGVINEQKNVLWWPPGGAGAPKKALKLPQNDSWRDAWITFWYFHVQ